MYLPLTLSVEKKYNQGNNFCSLHIKQEEPAHEQVDLTVSNIGEVLDSVGLSDIFVLR